MEITLNGQTRRVNKVRALALRELAPAMEIIQRIQVDTEHILTAQELDKLVHWFCIFLGGDTTPEAIYADYPADRLTYDISLAAIACQSRMTEALTAFPTPGRGPKAETASAEA